MIRDSRFERVHLSNAVGSGLHHPKHCSACFAASHLLCELFMTPFNAISQVTLSEFANGPVTLASVVIIENFSQLVSTINNID